MVSRAANNDGFLFYSMRKLLILLLLPTLLSGCSEFNKALKSTDADYKLEVAEKYIAKESFDRAIPLLEELIVITRGTEKSEKVNYLHAKATWGMKDYTLAAYYLANFVRTFPKSQYAEECAFLSAYCQYQNSPTYELDQTDTRNAMDQMQLFLVRYPTSTLKDSCNTLIDAMRTKLEVKSFHGAQQYFKMRNYRAASVAFKDFNREWPNSKYREDAMFFILRSDVELALNSVESKKLERLKEAIKTYHNFADAFPQSVLLPDADKLHESLEAALAQETRTSTP